MTWINSLKPSWSKTPHLTASEMHELATTAGDIAALDAETKSAVERYAASPAGEGDWALANRSRFIGNYTEVVQRAVDSKPLPTTSLGGRKPRKVTDLRNT